MALSSPLVPGMAQSFCNNSMLKGRVVLNQWPKLHGTQEDGAELVFTPLDFSAWKLKFWFFEKAERVRLLFFNGMGIPFRLQL